MKKIVLEVWGDYACFTPPYAKVERMSYPFPTPSAARGILSAIYSKPKEFYWQIDQIQVLRPIQYISFKRNEVTFCINDKPVAIDESTIKVRNGKETIQYPNRTQRQTVALKDVRYRISASIVPRTEFADRLQSLYEQAHRRIAAGKCFMQPSFGLREFVAYFEEYDSERHTDEPIKEDLDAGLMVYDIFDLHDYEVRKKTQTKLTLYHAVMEQGVINIPPYDSSEVLKGE